MIYLDTSALAKLVVDEPESAALAQWLDARPDVPLVTSALTRVELVRAARRRDTATVAAALALVGECALVPLDPVVLDAAAHAEPPGLRSLDALHLASAALLGADLTAVVSYDDRLVEAAQAAGLPCAAPS